MKSPDLSANHDLIMPTKHFHEIFCENKKNRQIAGAQKL